MRIMKLISYARTSRELELLKSNGASEAILSHQGLARLGNLGLESLQELARSARKLDLRPILEWDILMTNEGFSEAAAILDRIDLSLFDAVRVQDPGAFEYVLKRYPALGIQLVLESGNHNFEAIYRWCEYGGNRLERVVLSIELPKNRIAQYIEKLPVQVEILGLGPILLLYTPRHLLSNQRQNFEELKGAQSSMPRSSMPRSSIPMIRALATSEETQHKGFRIIENRHGTLMFHSKDYCLLDRVEELHEMNLAALRVDFRLESRADEIMPEALRRIHELLVHPSNKNGDELISTLPTKVTRCFFQGNATDVLFKKLKNTTVQRQDLGYIGEVVEISKGHHTIISVLGKDQRLTPGQKLTFINPEGHTLTHAIDQLRDLDQREVSEIVQGDFAVIPYLKFATQRTAVYRGEDH